MKIRLLTVFGASLLMTGVVLAQQTPVPTPAPTPTSAPNSVNQRRENQQDRIANGVQSGQLTAGETRNLEGREANLNNEIKDDRQADGGKLTQAERQQVNRQQNRISNSIYQDKHNAATQNYKGEVGARQQNQQDRIAQGIRSGQMTAGEASRAEGQQQRINNQVGADRQANGGRLTAGERQQIHQRQNNASRNIYNKKHNGATQAH